MSDFHFETELLLNMQMLEDNLLENYNVFHSFFRDNRQFLTGAYLYHGQSQLLDSVVYVGRGEIFDQFPIEDNRIPRICIGKSKRSFSGVDYVIELTESQDWEAVFNCVQEIFLQYSAFSHKLFHILNTNGGLNELSAAALDFFRNPVLIHDENFNVLAMPMWVVGMARVEMDEATGNPTIPMDRIHLFLKNPEYRSTLDTHGANLWSPSYSVHRVIYDNIWSFEGDYLGRLLIMELNAPLKPSDFTMAEYFVKILSFAIDRNQFKSANFISFENMLQQILSGAIPSPEYIKEKLNMVGWNPEDRFICLKTRMDDPGQNVVSVKKICASITNILTHCYSFSHERAVYSVLNLTLANFETEECQLRLSDFLSNMEAVTGVSMPFSDFREFPEYARQAAKAIALGKQKNPDSRFFDFSRYILDYIILHFTEEFSAQSICSEAVRKLIASDQENKTDYLHTLQVYFDNNYQSGAAAKALFIHRSTLTYRLEKIYELTGADINDPYTRLYMQISMWMVQKQ